MTQNDGLALRTKNPCMGETHSISLGSCKAWASNRWST